MKIFGYKTGGSASKRWLAFAAMAFLQWTGCLADYAGIYTGTFSGGDAGKWHMTVDSSGVSKGFLYSDSDTNVYTSTGTVAVNGLFRLDAIGSDSDFSGVIDGSGDVSGVWTNSYNEKSGGFTGQRVVLGTNSASIVNSYYPMRIGQQWNYRGVGIGQNFTLNIKVDSSETVDGVSCLRANYSINGISRWYAQDADGAVWQLKGQDTGDDYFQMPASPAIGSRFNISTSLYKVVSTSALVITPAGTFIDCLQLEYLNRPYGIKQSDYYAPGIGWVKSYTPADTVSGTLEAGWELTSYSGSEVDLISPTVKITSPAANSRVSNSVCVVRGTATDNRAVTSVWVQVNGGAWTNAAGTANWTSTVELAAGPNTISVACLDTANNESAHSNVFCTYVVAGSLSITTNGAGTVTRTPTNSIEIGQTYTLTATSGAGYGFTGWTGDATGTNPVVTVKATSNTAVTATFTDNVKPSVTIATPAVNARLSNAVCVVSGMAADDKVVASVWIQVNSGAWTNAAGTTNWTGAVELIAGPNTIRAYSMDAAGNYSAVSSVACAYVLDGSISITTNGVGTVTRTPATPVEIGQTYTLTATPGAGYGFVNWTGDVTGVSQVVTVKATSNTAVIATFADNVKPAVTIISPETNSRLSNATCVVSGTASDDQAVASVQIQLNNGAWTNTIGTTNWNSTVELVAGSNTIRAYSIDATGNHSATASVACAYVLEGSLTITTNGVGTVTRTPDTPVEIGQTYTLTATPGDGYGFVNWTGDVTGVSQVVTVTASSNTAVVANFADNVKPDVTITTPAVNARLSNAVCVVSGTATDNQGVVSVQIQLNSGAWTNAIGTTNWNSTVELVAGSNTIRVYSMDAASNCSVTASVACAYVLEGSLTITTNGVGTVTRTPTNAVEIGQTYTLTATPGVGYGFVNWAGAVTGVSQVVTVTASSNTAVVANFADNVKPGVIITTPAANARLSNAVCVVSGTATDDQAVTSVWVQVNGGTWTNAIGTTNWNGTVELVAGSNTIRVYSMDGASNHSATASVACTYVVAGSLTITTNGVGTVTRTPTNSIEIGQTYTLTATSGAGYGFTGWTGDATGTNPVVTVKATSNTAVTATFTDNVKPSVTIAAPAVNARLSNAVCVVSGTATDDQAVTSVWIQINSGAWTNAAGTTNWTGTLELTAGPNTIRAYSMDAAGNYSAVSSVACAYVLDGSISITTNGVGTVTRTPATPVEIGQTYTLTATPGAGYGFVNWTGDVTGVSQVVTVKATSNTAVIATFADNVKPAVIITSPETDSRLSNATCAVSGTASDDQAVTSVQIQLNNGAWTNAIGTTNWNSTVELVAGSNTIQVYSIDATGNHSATASVACAYVLAGSLTITTNGVGTVTRTPDTPVEIGQTYTLTATPGDGYGFVNWTGDVTGVSQVVTVTASSNTAVVANFTDNVKPSVTIVSPEINSRLSNTTCVVSGTATDNLDVVSVQIQLNSGAWTNAIGTTNWTGTVELVAGSNTIRVYSIDATGNHSVTASVACAYVLEGSISITTNGVGTVTRTPDTPVEIGQTYTLTATPGDGYGFVNWTGDVTGVSQVVSIKATSNTTVIANFADNVSPSLIITAPAPDSRVSNSICVVSGTASDDQEVDSIWINLNNGEWVEASGTTNWTSTVELVAGPNTISVGCIDAADNRSAVSNVVCTYVVAGSLTITTNGVGTVTRSPETPVEIGQTYTLTATPGTGYEFVNWTGDVTGSDPEVTVTATSNTVVVANFSDNVRPSVTVLTPESNSRVSNAVCVVSGTAADDKALASVWVQVNNGAWTNAAGTTNWTSTIELVAGPNTIRVYSMDAANNHSAIASVFCTYVLEGSISIATNGVGTVTRTPATPVEIGQTYTLTATPGAGYGFVNWTGDVTGVSQVVTVKATSNTAVIATFADNVKPAVTITSPETDSRLSNATCVVSGTATDDQAVASVQIQLNSGAWTNAIGTTNWNSTVELVAGSNTIRVYSIDATGNHSATASVACAYVLEGSISITTNGLGTATRTPVTPVEIGQTYTLTATPSNGYRFVNWTGAVTSANPVVTVKAASNTAVIATFADNVKPAVTIMTPAANTRLSNAVCDVSGTAADNQEVVLVQVKLNGVMQTNVVGTTSWTSTVELAAGTNTISVYSQDAASNRSVTASVVCTYVVEGSLTITTNGLGTATRAPATPVEIGQTYTLTATPSNGYRFVNWTGGVTSDNPVVTVKAASNTAVAANFADNVKPSVIITAPAPDSRVSNSVCVVSGTATDDQAVTSVWMQVNGGVPTNAFGTTSWTGTVELAAGPNTISVYSQDAAGNCSVTANVGCTYVLEGSLTIATNGVGTVTRTPDTPVEIGQTYTLTATPGEGYGFVDWGGAVTGVSQVVTVKATSNTAVIATFADNVKPSVTITAPEPDSRVSNSVCVVSGTASDDQAVASVGINVNDTGWVAAAGTTNWTGTVELAAGPNVIVIACLDAANNESVHSNVVCTYVVEGSLTITTNGVGTVTRTPATPVEIGQTYTLTATPGSGYRFVNWIGAVTSASPVVTVTASSNAAVAANFVDNVKPTVTIMTPETNSRLSNATCVVSGTANDDQAVVLVKVRVNNGPWTDAAGTNNWTGTAELAAGLNTIRVYSMDAAGNSSVTASVTCTYVVEGSLTITTNGVGTVTRTPDTPVEIGQTYTLTAAPGAGYRFAKWEGSVTGTRQTVTVTVTSNTAVVANFADNVKPAVTILTPEFNSRVSNAVCVVSGTAIDDQTVTSVWVQVNGGALTNALGTTNWTGTIELAAGPNTISVYSQDAAGNRSDVASVACTYVVEGSLTITTNGIGTVTRTPDTPVEIGQTYTLTAAPGAGHRFVKWEGSVTGTRQTVTVTATSNTAVVANFADNVRPAVTVITPGPGSRLSNAVCIVSGTATDDQAVTSVRVQVNGGAWTNAAGTNNWTSAVELAAGSNTIRVYSQDAASNQSTVASVTCTYVVEGCLTITTNGLGTVTRTPATPVEIGQTYTLTATPGAGYGLANWSGAATGTNKVVTVTATSNTTVVANFADNVKPSVFISAPATNSRVSNAVCVVSGTATDDQAVTSVWVQVNGGVPTNAFGTTSWTGTVELVAGPNTISVYSQDAAGNRSSTSNRVCTYVVAGSLNIATNGLGAVTRTPTNSVEMGQVYTLTVKPGAGYGFVNWAGDATGTNKVITLKATSNTAVTANFADIAKPTVLIAAPKANLRISNALCVVSGTATDNQAVASVRIQVNSGVWSNAFGTTNWTGTVELTAGSNTIRVYSTDAVTNRSAVSSVVCTYVVPGNLTIQTNGSGKVTIAPAGAAEVGKTYTLTAAANTGSAFANWTGDNTTTNKVITFVMTSNMTFTANFTDNEKPKVAITVPSALQKVYGTNGDFTVRGTASDNLALSNVVVKVNSGSFAPAGTTTNVWKNWSQTVTLIPGTNTIAAYSVDTTGNNSATVTVKCVYTETGALNITTNGPGKVTVAPTGPLLLGKTYTLTAAANAGAVFSNWTGDVTSTGKVVTITLNATNKTVAVTANFTDTEKPKVVITYPANNAKVLTNGLVVIRGTAADNGALSEVKYQLRTGDWTNAVSTNVFKAWTADYVPVAGLNTSKVYSVDAQGNVSATSTVVFTYIPGAVLTVETNGNGTVTPSLNGKVLQLGSTNTMTAAAKTGYVFTNWTYGVGGSVVTNGKTVKFVMTTNLVLTANFRSTAIPDAVADAAVAPQVIVVDGATEDWAGVSRSSLTEDQDVAAVISGSRVALLLTGCPFGTSDTVLVYFKLRLTCGEGDNRHTVDLWTSGSALYGMMDGKALEGLEAVLAGGVLEVQFPVADAPSKVTIEEVGCGMDLGAGMTEVFGVTLSVVN